VSCAAVAGLVVAAALGHAGQDRQDRLGPVQRLGPGFLVRAQHDCSLRRVVVQAGDIDDLLREQRVRRDLEPIPEIRPIVDSDRPLRFAIEARDQCVASSGACSSVVVTTFSTLSSRIDGGRPGRGSSVSPSSRCAVNLPRHQATVPSVTCSCAAACLLLRPSAQASTILARIASACADLVLRAHRVSWSRSVPVSSSAALGRPGRSPSASPASLASANWRRHLPTVSADTPSAAATWAFAAPGSAHASTIRARQHDPRPCRDPGRAPRPAG
jgi:hypothetical protein